MIFISYNHEDNGVVTPIAQRLAQIFNQGSIFFDKWSLRPGDSIIEGINSGLSAAKFFVLFVTERSLQSQMVGLEWRPALMKQIKGECRFIVVRLQDVVMPTVLTDLIYIDALHSGFETTIRQIVDTVQGNQTLINQSDEVSNLYWTIEQSEPDDMLIYVRAAYFLNQTLDF